MAAAVTGYGRTNLYRTKELIEENSAFEVIAGDTDSCFVKLSQPVINPGEAKNIGRNLAQSVSRTLPQPMELNYEAYAKRVIFFGKKRYAMWRFEERREGVWKDSIKMKGIETVRRDWCKLSSNTLAKCLEIILREGDEKKVLNFARTVIHKVKTANLDEMFEDLMLTKEYSKDVSKYRNKQPHVELVERMKAQGDKVPAVGERISYVIVKNGGKSVCEKAEDPGYALEHKLFMDRDYYLEP
jgi:DNA polymerase I